MPLFLVLLLCASLAEGALLTLQIQNHASLQSIVDQVSDPTHPNYLKFLTDDEIHDRFAPTPQHIDAVAEWLNGSSYSLVSGRRWQLDVDSAAVPIPPHIRSIVRGFDVAITPLVKGDSLPGMAYAITVPQTLMTVYNSPNPTTYVSQNTVRYAVVSEQVTDSFLTTDVSLFAALSGTQPPNITAFNSSGSNGPAGVESSLDLDTLISMAPAGSSIQYIMNSDSDSFAWCTQILNTPDSSTWPHMVSFSWGQQEVAGVQSELAGNDCLALLASAGVSVIASSGDDGVYGANTYCDPTFGFLPSLPASSPYATAVGATTFPGTGSQQFTGVPLCNSSLTVSQMGQVYGFTTGAFSDYPNYPLACYIDKAGPEVAVSKTLCQFTSGGGFSKLFAQPSWQQTAVNAYLSNPSVPLPSTAYWNKQNRGFPDVSMYGCGSPVLMGGALEYEGGTSQSAPLFAGVMGYVVDWYISRHGKGPGFLNPLLYQLFDRNPLVFNDVVTGNNNGTSQQYPSQCQLGGFTTAPGWDPVTGLGTPNIRAMIAELELMFTTASPSSTGPATTPYVIVTTTTPASSVPVWVYGLIGAAKMMLSLLILLLLAYECTGARLTMCIQNLTALDDLVWRVASPSHRDYLQYPTADELHHWFAPTVVMVDEVVAALNSSSSYTLVDGLRWQVDVPIPVSTDWSHPYVQSMNVLPVSIPRAVNLSPQPATSPSGPVWAVVNAQTLANVYNAPNPTTYTTSNSLRITVVSEDTRDSYLASDMTAFEAVMGVAPKSFINVGYYPSSGAGAESSLDMDMVTSITPAGTTVTYMVNNSSDFSAWCYDILNSGVYPHVVSLSWGQEELVAYPPQENGNSCLGVLAAAGVTIVVATGDDGAWGFINKVCDPTQGYYPNFPSTSPYATAVGGTRFDANDFTAFAGVPFCAGTMTSQQLANTYGIGIGAFGGDPTRPVQCYTTNSDAEVAATKDTCSFFNGGGFSFEYLRPSWQNDAVLAYMNNPSVPFPDATTQVQGFPLWNTAGRGFPDVSVYGCGSVVVESGSFSAHGGTSQSAPVFAGLMTYIVDWYLTRFGVGPGPLNPLLYHLYAINPATFNDVVVGNNNGTTQNEPGNCALGGFTTAPGWDAVTGLGTPNIGLILAELNAMFPLSSTSTPSSTASPTSAPLPTSNPTSTPPTISPTSAPTPTSTPTPTVSPTSAPVPSPSSTQTPGPTSSPTTSPTSSSPVLSSSSENTPFFGFFESLWSTLLSLPRWSLYLIGGGVALVVLFVIALCINHCGRHGQYTRL